MDFQAIVGGTGSLDIGQADEPANAVVDMDDEVPGAEAGHLGDEISGALAAAPRPHQPVAQNVLLADDRELGGLEAGLEPEHREPHFGLRPPQRIRKIGHVDEVDEPVVGEHVAHALARALAPQCDQDALAVRLQRADVGGDGVVQIAVGLGAFGGEIASLPRADLDDGAVAAFRHGERRHTGERHGPEPLRPFGFAEIEPVRRQRLVRRAHGLGVERVAPRLIIIGDLREPLLGRVLDQRIEHDGRTRRIIEQSIELLVEQREPMLHAGIAAALAHRFVQNVVRRGGAEFFRIALAEAADGFRRELELAHGHELERAQLPRTALGLRIEAADRFQRIAEEIEPHAELHAGSEQIDDAAAHRVFAGIAHRRSAGKAVELEPAHHAVHGEHIAGGGGERLSGDELARRHPLQRGVDGGEQDGSALPFRAGEPRQSEHALRNRARVRRHPVVRQAVPRREFEHGDFRGEELERARELAHPRRIAADHDERSFRRIGASRDRTREIRDDERRGPVRHAGKRERTPRLQGFCR